MKIKLSSLRAVIRKTILESYEAEERVYDDTVLPGEEADSDLLAEPDLTHQKNRDEYLDDKKESTSKKKRARLQSQEETLESISDEASMAGGAGGSGGSIRGHVGGAWGPRKKSKKLQPKNAMSISKALDEYDE